MCFDAGRYEDLLLRIAVDRGIEFDPRPLEMDVALPSLTSCVDLLVAQLPEPAQRRWLAAALAALSHDVQLSARLDPLPLEQRLAVAVAVIAGARGVLVVRRRDHVPLGAFPAERSNRTRRPPRPRSARSPRKPASR